MNHDGGHSLKLRTMYPKVLRYSEIDGAVCFVKLCAEGFATSKEQSSASILISKSLVVTLM